MGLTENEKQYILITGDLAVAVGKLAKDESEKLRILFGITARALEAVKALTSRIEMLEEELFGEAQE